MAREFDIASWNRRAAYEYFKDFDDPFFNVTSNVRVGRLRAFCRGEGLSFSQAVLFYTLRAANEIREFRLRIEDGRVVEHARIHATHTILAEDETFWFAYFELQDDVFAFDKAGKTARQKYAELRSYDIETARTDLIYCSALPWLSFTSFKHASRFDKTKSVPRIVFGKFTGEGDEMIMPLSIEVNHAMMDGIHVGRFYELFQQLVEAV